MTTPLKIDFVSDIVCPWCAIGLSALERALSRVGEDIAVDMHIQPFELNPHMPPGGQEMTEHLTQKYGSSLEDQERAYEAIRSRGAELGFDFRVGGRSRTYNTFDAHRLLYWAGLPDIHLPGTQLALKKALLKAYFTFGEAVDSHAVLARVATEAGLDEARAGSILADGEYADEVREREHFYTEAGIQAVPAAIIDDRYLVSGGQPVGVFEQALRKSIAQRR